VEFDVGGRMKGRKKIIEKIGFWIGFI